VTDCASLLHLTGECRLAELKLTRSNWLDGKTLAEARLREEGIKVLKVERPGGVYIGNLTAETSLQEGDTLVLCGSIADIKELDQREKGYWGDREHREAVREQEKVLEEKARKDRAEK
jgi:Trk K+ transport system NAD-binding subunit